MDRLVKDGVGRIKFAILIGTDAKLIEDALRAHAPLVEYKSSTKAIKGRELMDEVVRFALAKASRATLSCLPRRAPRWINLRIMVSAEISSQMRLGKLSMASKTPLFSNLPQPIF